MVETINTEQRELQKKKPPESNELQLNKGIDGKFKSIFGGGRESVPVEILKPETVNRLFAMIKANAEDREALVKGKIADELPKVEDDDTLIEEGEKARTTTLESQVGLAGFNKLLAFFSIMVGNNRVFSEGKMAGMLTLPDESVKGISYTFKNLDAPDLNRSAIMDDMTNLGVPFWFAIDDANGADLKQIFETYGHRVVEIDSPLRGFQAEMNGIRMAFLYPDDNDMTEEKKEKVEAEKTTEEPV